MIHGIEITHRPGRSNKVHWECLCGAWDKSKSITKGYQSAARHLEVTNPQCKGTTIPYSRV